MISSLFRRETCLTAYITALAQYRKDFQSIYDALLQEAGVSDVEGSLISKGFLQLETDSSFRSHACATELARYVGKNLGHVGELNAEATNRNFYYSWDALNIICFDSADLVTAEDSFFMMCYKATAAYT